MPELGNAQLASGRLGDTGTFLPIADTPPIQPTTGQLQSTLRSINTLNTTDSPTIVTGDFNPVVLDPQNISVRYNQQREAWESAWIPTDTFDSARDQLVAVVNLRADSDPVEVVIERDTTGDKTPDLHSEILTIGLPEEIARADPVGERGSYRLVFPRYNQFDVVDRLNVALTVDNTERLIDNIPHQFLRNDIRSENVDGSDDIQPLIDALGITLDRIDATIDSVYDNRFVESARGGALNNLGRPVGVQRRDIGNPQRADDRESDDRLRKRVQAARALVGLDSTTPSVSQLLSVLFPDAVTAITYATVPDEPVLDVTIPTNAIDRNPLTESEITNILNDCVAASYRVTVTAQGTYEYSQPTNPIGWNDGGWTRPS
jgi:hypothetical protein